MRALLLFATIFALTPTSRADSPSHVSRPSPDGQWLVAWTCNGNRQADSCSITVSHHADLRVLFSHQTSDRDIQAAWSSDSSKCLLLEAPDNANTCLWLLRVRGRNLITEEIKSEKISASIESTLAAAHRSESAAIRSGIQKIEWLSTTELRLHVIYNAIPVIVLLDVAKPQSPEIRVRSEFEKEFNAMVAAIEPLQAPAYDRGRKFKSIEEHGASKNVTVSYKVRSPLRGDKLVADIVRRFIHANWDAGLPKGFSGGGGLGFHRDDFSPAPGAFSICYAIVNISEDEESIQCMYSFRSR
jgi:hypothetical protein